MRIATALRAGIGPRVIIYTSNRLAVLAKLQRGETRAY